MRTLCGTVPVSHEIINLPEVPVGRVVAMVNSKGGAGKTTAVVECAYQAGKNGRTVLVVDLDPQGNATEMLTASLKHPGTIFDLFVDKDGAMPIGNVVAPALEAWPNVLVVPASGNMSTVDAHLGSRAGKERILRRILQPVREAFDLVLIDLGPAADFLMLNALVAADVYHVPTDLSEFTLKGLETVQDLAEDVRASGVHPGIRFDGIHVSGFHKGHSHAVVGLVRELEIQIGGPVTVRVPHSAKVIDSQRQHRPVGAIDPEGPIAKAYATLTERFFQ